jgi:hypothetical protein
MPHVKELAKCLQQALHAGLDEKAMQAELGNLSEALKATAAEITVQMDMQQPQIAIKHQAHGVAIDPARLVTIRAQLQALQAFLENDDIQAYYLWQDLAPELHEMIGAQAVEGLGVQIERFDYTGARHELRRLLAHYHW